MKKKHMNKTLVLLISFLLILTFSVGGTLAYLMRDIGVLDTVFVPGSVECAVEETEDGYTVKNLGNTGVFVRGVLVLNWTRDEKISGFHTISEDDYEVLADGWTTIDGYLVCEKEIAPEESTPPVSIVITADVPEEGYELKIEFLAEAVQSEPASIAEEAWGFSAE